MTGTPISGSADALPQIGRVTLGELWVCLKAGAHDFRRAPAFGLFFSAVYVLGGFLLLMLGAGPVEQYVRVVQGVADVAWGLPGYASSQFETTMIVELPNAIPLDAPGYEAIWAAYEEHLADEFPGTVPVALWTSEPNVFIMKDHDIRTPADVAGLKPSESGFVSSVSIRKGLKR